MRDTTFLKKILDHEAFIMKITSHNKTFEWRLRLVEWRYAQAALLGTALALTFRIKICIVQTFWSCFSGSYVVYYVNCSMVLFVRQAFSRG